MPFNNVRVPFSISYVFVLIKIFCHLCSQIHEAIVSGQLIQKIWAKTELPAVNVCQILREHPDGKHALNK